MTRNQFFPIFKPIREAGHGNRMREYRRCNFTVAVWDHTSDNNKLGYKNSYIVVKDVFILIKSKTIHGLTKNCRRGAKFECNQPENV